MKPRPVKQPKKAKPLSLLTKHIFKDHEKVIDASRPKVVEKRESVLVRPTRQTLFLKKQAKEAEDMSRRAAEVAARAEKAGGWMMRSGTNGDDVLGRKRSAVEAELETSMSGEAVAGGHSKVHRVEGDQDVKTTLVPKEQTLFLMDLPRELRNKIWRASVVSDTTFVFPEDELGREQPDLAMVSRQVRNEVLKLFYEENTFAIDVSKDAKSLKEVTVHERTQPKNPWILERRMDASAAKPMSAMAEWARVMRLGGWLGSVRRWAFRYNMSPSHKEGTGYIVFVNLIKSEVRSRSALWTAEVTIHRNAACVLPGCKEAGKCAVKNTPRWLNKPVIDLLDTARDMAGMSDEKFVHLAIQVQTAAGLLMALRCETAGGESEPKCGSKD